MIKSLQGLKGMVQAGENRRTGEKTARNKMPYVTKQEKIVDARKTLGLGESATLMEIKEAYRQLAKKYHPDSGKFKDQDKMGEIILAYKILMNYIQDYRYSFKMKDVLAQNPEWMWEKAYAEDSTWGRVKKGNRRPVSL
ncbi:MAG: J domain-containing protein [Candidatus Altiarchaeota archaeon]|nr:J domain-containing protein [Candidatus Altiarchaeota archaeon]